MFRTLKKYWRLVFGVSFIASGLSVIGTTPAPAYVTIAIGAAFTIWHFVTVRRQSK